MNDEQMTSPTSEGRADHGEAFEAAPADSEYDTDSVREDRVPTAVYNQLVSVPHEYFELGVEIIVRLPDGTRFTYEESVEKDAPDDYDLDEAATMLDAVTEVMTRRLTHRLMSD